MSDNIVISEQQFTRLICTLSRNNEDHDILLQLKNTMDLTLKHQEGAFCDHIKEDAEEFVIINRSVKKVHLRIDSLMTLKDKLLGAGIVIMFIITTAVSLYTVSIR